MHHLFQGQRSIRTQVEHAAFFRLAQHRQQARRQIVDVQVIIALFAAGQLGGLAGLHLPDQAGHKPLFALARPVDGKQAQPSVSQFLFPRETFQQGETGQLRRAIGGVGPARMILIHPPADGAVFGL